LLAPMALAALSREIHVQAWHAASVRNGVQPGRSYEGAPRGTGPCDESCQREGLPGNRRKTFTTSLSLRTQHRSFLRDVFGEDKMSVRTALGVTALPLGAPVMLEVMF
jgi:hypothetical protein